MNCTLAIHVNSWRKFMTKKRYGIAGVLAAAALAVSSLVVPSAYANNEIVVWADETRGKNLEEVLKVNGDWVSGYKVTIKAFSNFDALKEAFDKATDASGPDIVMGANDWVPTGAKSGKLAPITLTASQKARFTPGQLFDLTYRGKLYGVPVDVNNVAMIYNTDIVKTAPKTFGEMVAVYKANRASKSLKAGLCVAGGGMSWGAHSIFSALGADAYQFNSRYKIVYGRSFNGTVFGKNVRTYLLDGKIKGKSNGFLPASDAGCKDNFIDGKVPYAIIGNWEWKDYVDKGFTMNLMPVPGVSANKPGKMFGSVSGALLTTFAAKHGVEAGAKSLLTKFFGSTDGQVRYQKIEGRPPAEKGAALDATVSVAQRGFGAAASLSSIPQIGAFLNNNAGGANYWDSAPAYWTAVLVDGKNPVTEGNKLAAIWRENISAGRSDL